MTAGIQELNKKERELLLFLLSNGIYKFTPIEIADQIGVTNKTVINRLSALVHNGFVIPVKVNERIRSYRVSPDTQIKGKAIIRELKQLFNVKSYDSLRVVDYSVDYYSSEKLLAQLIIEGYSGEELLSEFKLRHSQLKQGIDAILNNAKNAYKDSGFGEEIPYEIIPESKNQNYKRNIWDAAIGLQAVDGLKPSKYLRKLADENIAGKKTYEEIDKDLKKKYGTDKSHQHEADTVSLRIAQMLEFSEFSMTINLLLTIHSYLFDEVLEPDIVGIIRKYNIRKREPILLGDSVYYSDYISIKSKLIQILDDEKEYKYSMPMSAKDINHLSEFTSKIWQTHPFGEGNTRTTAVFIELYLKSLGYEVNNIPFKDYSDYYRNALVRSCYSSETYESKQTYEYLNRFYTNLLNKGNYILDSFDLFISNKE